MKLPLEISFEGLDRSAALEDAVRKHADKLEQHHGDIMRCRVAIVCDGKHKHQGKPFAVAIDLTIPGQEIVSNRAGDEDVYVAVHDAFKSVTRQLDQIAQARQAKRV